MRDTIDMMREAGIHTAKLLHAYGNNKKALCHSEIEELQQIERFADLVRADEREQVIALQQHEDVLAPIGHSAWGEAYQEGWAEGTAAYRDTIRARGETK